MVLYPSKVEGFDRALLFNCWLRMRRRLLTGQIKFLSLWRLMFRMAGNDERIVSKQRGHDFRMPAHSHLACRSQRIS